MPALRTRDTPAVPSLEVKTSAPPPSLTIISPTPRAFTFPISHNLADSPYSSPSNSPFEPDLRALALSSSSSTTPSSCVDEQCLPRTPPPLSAYTRTLSPAEAYSPPRRKSTTGEERRPKKGDEDYVKRPENAFILFRRNRVLGTSTTSVSAPSSLAAGPSSADSPALAGNGKKQRQADLSKTISQQWKALSAEERSHWEDLAKQKKKEHEALHPNYVYRPQRTKNRAAGSSTSAARRKNSAPAPAAQDIEFVVPAPRGQHGRSASAPTPPPYQSIQIPNLYLGAAPPASPDSPTSLIPMISRRGGQSGFDYMPSFGAAFNFDFEANLQSSDFLRAMFPAGGATDAESSILSPASSASGSGPSSPYTPAASSFHPSATQYAGQGLAPSDFSLDEPTVQPAEDYAAYTSPWAAASPWAATPASDSVFAEGDFDISRIPELGWDLSCGAQSSCQGELAYPGEFSMDMGGAGLNLHFGGQTDGSDLGGVSEMGFDEMMTGAGF